MLSGRLDARARVLQELAALGSASRAELAHRVELAFSTVSAAVSDLQAEGFVVESESAAPAAQRSVLGLGRPSAVLSLHRRAGVAVGMDVGKQHLHAVLADLAHVVLAERRVPLEPDMPAAAAADVMSVLLDEMLTESNVSRTSVLGVGLGLPGPIRIPDEAVGDSAILPGWVGIRAADLVSDALEVPVKVSNDANLGALGEWMWGAGRGVDDLLFLKVATGIGGGLIIGGRPFAGTGGTAGEIGHITVAADGPVCRCGNRGCLEMMAGSQAVLQALIPVRGPSITLEEAIRCALDGDVGCARAIADAGHCIGSALGTVVNVINPSRVVIGGELAGARTVLLHPMKRALDRTSISSAAADVEIVLGELGDRAIALGGIGLIVRSTRADAIARAAVDNAPV